MRFPLSFCAGLAVLLLPELCHAGESLATTLVNAGIRQASLAAAGPLPLVETVCGPHAATSRGKWTATAPLCATDLEVEPIRPASDQS
jgi:hypothetical protein